MRTYSSLLLIKKTRKAKAITHSVTMPMIPSFQLYVSGENNPTENTSMPQPNRRAVKAFANRLINHPSAS